MRTPLIALSLALLATAALAQTPQPAAETNQTQQAQAQNAADVRLDTLAVDLRALSRIVAVAKELKNERQVMLAIIDQDVEQFREPRGDGTYKWASLQREEASRVAQDKGVEKVSTEAQLDQISVAAPRAYRLVVVVPKKRNLVSANNKVFVKNAVVEMTGFDGKVSQADMPINVWVNPGDSYGVALPAIARSASATVFLGVESGTKKGFAQAALLQAKLVDDSQSPYFPAVQKLLSIRDLASAEDIRRGDLQTRVEEAINGLPGQLEKSIAAQHAEAEMRLKLASGGQMKGTIGLGDATPDVVKQLSDSLQLMSGTLDQQTEARKQLEDLLKALSPPSPVVTPAPQQ